VRVLCIIPPYVPSYFNAGHHLPVFQVAQYLRVSLNLDVEAVDYAALNATWRDICVLLAKKFDLILMLNDYDSTDSFERFVNYAREISPESKIGTFGRASRDVPAFFDRFGLDAIGSAGDYEISMGSYIKYLENGDAPQGVRLLQSDNCYQDYAQFEWLTEEQWVFPDVSEIPYAAYEHLNKDDLKKFCGIANRSELVVPVARGCPVGCSFCDVPRQQGLRERRVPTERVVGYVKKSFAVYPFEYASFYAPTFTLKRNWVKALCNEFHRQDVAVKWKCVTTVAHLDRELITLMRDAGCIRISVGVESFAPEVAGQLPALKRDARAGFLRVAHDCQKLGVELNCFLMFGLQGEPVTHSIDTMKVLVTEGHRVRPTVYTPYENLAPDMSQSEFAAFNRQLFLHHELSAKDKQLLYQSLYNNGFDVASNVHLSIPQEPHSVEHDK